MLVQPTTFCNIDCLYCYLPTRNSRNILKSEVLEQLIRVLGSCKPEGKREILFSWHGGEPLSVGPKFFAAAFRQLQSLQDSGYAVTHAVQTNGTLLSDSFARIFQENRSSLSLSIDGPPEFHDKYRRYRNGRGTFDRVLAGIQLLQRWNLKYSVISVISAAHLDNLELYFRFIRSLDVPYVALLMPEIEGVNKSSFLQEYSDSALVSFWRDVLALAVRYRIRVREIDYCLLRFVHPTVQHATTIPYWFLNVAHDGRYSTFDPELMGQPVSGGSPFYLGHLSEDLNSHWKIFSNSSIYQDILNGVRSCKRTCEYYSVCGGGPIGNKYFENGTFDSTETLACRFRIKRLVDALIAASASESSTVDAYVALFLAK